MKTADDSFGKKHKLCSKTLTESLFAQGRSLFAHPFKCVYHITDAVPEKESIQVLISVSKRRQKRAVKRNLLKRRTREAYRLNKGLWGDIVPEGKSLLVAFIYSSDDIINYSCIEDGIRKAILSIKKRGKKSGGISPGSTD